MCLQLMRKSEGSRKLQVVCPGGGEVRTVTLGTGQESRGQAGSGRALHIPSFRSSVYQVSAIAVQMS